MPDEDSFDTVDMWSTATSLAGLDDRGRRRCRASAASCRIASIA